MTSFYQLDLVGRAELLGLSCRELVRLAQDVDRRIVVEPSLSTPGAVARLRRWIAAGSPAPDFARLDFEGDDTVRELVLEVLRVAPAPVAWHAIEFVSWLEVGRSAVGWQGIAPKTRNPDGDTAHRIVLNGAHADEDLRGLIAHELGHSWAEPVRAVPSRPASFRSTNAIRIVAEKTGVKPSGYYVRAQVDEELRADALARLWGQTRPFDDPARLARFFAAEQAAAADLAEQIERELEGDEAA